jgi:hypothetical protein
VEQHQVDRAALDLRDDGVVRAHQDGETLVPQALDQR